MTPMDDLAARLTDPAIAAALLAPRLAAPAPGTWTLAAVTPRHSRRRISRRLLAEGGPWLDLVWTLTWQGPDGTALTQWWQGHAEAAPGGQPSDLHLTRIDASGPWAGFLASGGEIVRLEPGEHCTAHFPAAAGRPDHFAKHYLDARSEAARRTLDRLWAASVARRAAFHIGAPLPGEGATLRQRTVPGIALARQWASTAPDLRPLVWALADLARHGPRHGLPLDREAIVADCWKWHKKLRLADPALAPDLDAALAAIAEPPRAQLPAVPTHGDCHIDQMLWVGGRIALFDYDNLQLAEAGRDLADFVSQLLVRHDGRDWRPLAQRLVTAWADEAEDLHDAEVFAWHLRTLLLRKAYSQFVRSHRGWAGRCRDALALAAAPRDALPHAAQRVTS